MATILNLFTPANPKDIKSILVCIPWAGGNGAYFRQWVEYFRNASSIQLLAINLPGRGKDKSTIFKTVQSAAENISTKLQLFCKDQANKSGIQVPLVLFGHSLGISIYSNACYHILLTYLSVGGLIAYEIVRIQELLKSSSSYTIHNVCISAVKGPLELTISNQQVTDKYYLAPNSVFLKHVREYYHYFREFIYIYIYEYICMSICIYIYIYMSTNVYVYNINII